MTTNESLYISKQNMSAADVFLSKGFLWGEAPFTTMLLKDGEFIFHNLHMQRLAKTAEYLYEEDCVTERVKPILAKISADNPEGSLYVRVTLFSTLEGEVEFFIWTIRRSLSSASLKLTIRPENPCGDYPSFLKRGDYSFKFKSRDLVRAKGFDDVIFVDSEQNVLDTTTANVFIVRDGTVYTSELIPGVLDGVCRSQLLTTLINNGVPCKETLITQNSLLQSDEVFITNSFSGITFISQIDEKKFKTDFSLQIFDLFNSQMGNVWPRKK